MAAHSGELLKVAQGLLKRDPGQRGKLSGARIRRCISTAYYALFQFVIEEACGSIVGSGAGLMRRRRALARAFTHAGMKTALGKCRGASVEASVQEFMLPPKSTASAASVPPFARSVALAFLDAQARRHDADYDMNVQMSEGDAQAVVLRVAFAIHDWRCATASADRDFKHTLAILLLLRGRVRPD